MTDSTSLPFPHPTLTKIVGKPTPSALRELQREIYANATAVSTGLGGGNYGYLGLAMSAANYANLQNTVPFVAPVHPGAHPGHVAQATNAQITETNRQYLADTKAHAEYAQVSTELKKQLLQAIDKVYLMFLQDELLGYSNVTIRQMLEHLSTTYGVITPDSLLTNEKKMETDWNPDEPIELIWTRIRNCQLFAAEGNDPITDAHAVRATLRVFECTGLLTDAVRDWRKRPLAEWTMVNFRDHFTTANTERVRLLTAGNAGFHGANAAMPIEPTPTTSMQPSLPSGTHKANTATGTPTNSGVTMYYCWTHGLGKNRAHTSLTCNNKAEGHQDDATADNMMGGNDKIMRGRRPTAPA